MHTLLHFILKNINHFIIIYICSEAKYLFMYILIKCTP
jgi:hypothetical protein